MATLDSEAEVVVLTPTEAISMLRGDEVEIRIDGVFIEEDPVLGFCVRTPESKLGTYLQSMPFDVPDDFVSDEMVDVTRITNWLAGNSVVDDAGDISSLNLHIEIGDSAQVINVETSTDG